MAKTPLGRLPRDAIRLLELPRLSQDMLDGYRALVESGASVAELMTRKYK